MNYELFGFLWRGLRGRGWITWEGVDNAPILIFVGTGREARSNRWSRGSHVISLWRLAESKCVRSPHCCSKTTERLGTADVHNIIIAHFKLRAASRSQYDWLESWAIAIDDTKHYGGQSSMGRIILNANPSRWSESTIVRIVYGANRPSFGRNVHGTLDIASSPLETAME